MKISFYSNALKMAKFYKMAKCVFSWPVHFKNDRSGNPGSYNCTVKLMQELAYSAATGLSLVIIRLLPSSTSDFYVTLPYNQMICLRMRLPGCHEWKQPHQQWK